VETYNARLRGGAAFPRIVDRAWKQRRFGEAEDGGRGLHVIDPRVMVKLADEVGFVVKLVQLMGEEDAGFDYTGAIRIRPPLA
jgi:hypothetical protein